MARVAVITGACRGIGRALTLEFSTDYELALISRKKSDICLSLLGELGKRSIKVHFYEADISREEEVTQAFKQIKEDFKRIDVLINNAGITRDGTLVRMGGDDFRAVIDTNLIGSFYCAREAMKLMMRQRQGVIINISSVVGLQGNPGQANYAASKAGVIGLTKTLAKEYGARNIRVNAIAPGFIESDMTELLSEELKSQALEKISLGRFGRPEEVAALAHFLASDRAEYLTGQCLAIDGGISL